jgi:hypothetical protein
MAPTEPKISKEAATGTTRNTPFTTLGTLEIIMKLGNDTSQCHYGCIKDWIVECLWYTET